MQSFLLRKLERRIIWGFSAAIVTALLISLLSFFTLQAVIKAKDAVVYEHGHDLILLEQLALSTEKKVSHSRAYLFTGHQNYFTEVEQRRREFARHLATLRDRVEDPRERDYLDLIEQAERKHQLALEPLMRARGRRATADPALISVFEEQVKPLRDGIEASLSAFAAYKSALYETSKVQSARASRKGVWLVLLGGMLASVLGLSLYLLIQRTVRRLNDADSELRVAYGRARRLMDSSIVGVIYTDRANQPIDANEALAALVGYTRSELVSDPAIWQRQINPAEYEALDQTLDEKMERYGLTGPFEKELVSKDGQRVPVLGGAAIVDPASGERAYFMVDIKDRKRAEHDTATALKQLRDVKFALDQAAIVAVTDARGLITYVNDKFCEISKYPREELIGKTHRLINSGHHSREFFVELWHTISRGRVWRGEICNRARDGSHYWVDTTIVPNIGADGRPYQYVAIRSDVTVRKNQEKYLAASELKLRESLEARDTFLSIASHELKTPLTSLKLQTQALMRQAERSGLQSLTELDLSRLLHQSDMQLNRLARLVDDMLDIGRISTGHLPIELERADLCQIVNDTVNRLRPQAEAVGSKIEFEGCDPVLGWWDPYRIEQVINNLVSNAIRYGCGRPIELRVVHDAINARVEVTDYGLGIAPVDQRRIFERFERAVSANEVSGLGLGLHIASSIVHLHEGRIWVASELGHGATFYVELPRRGPARSLIESSESDAPPGEDSAEADDSKPRPAELTAS